jgi:hypothetical protein
MFHAAKFTDVFDAMSFLLTIHDCQNTYTDSYNCLPIFPRIHDYNGFSLDNTDAHHSSYYLYHSSCYTDNLPFYGQNGVKSKLINKFEDTSFINNIKCYDIIGLVETHLVESLPAPLNNYNIHHTYRKQNAKTKRNFGGTSSLTSLTQ